MTVGKRLNSARRLGPYFRGVMKRPKFDIRKHQKRPNLDQLKSAGLRVITLLARTSLPEIAFVATFIISHYLPNADFSYPYELVMPLVLFALLLSVVFYSYQLVFRRVLTAHIAALPVAYYLYHYDDLRHLTDRVLLPLLPNRMETQFTTGIVTILLTVLVFGALAYGLVWLAKFRNTLSLDLLATKIALFIVLFNFGVQAVVLGNYLFQTRHQMSYHYQTVPPQRTANATVTKPDIYYLVFDRYTNAENLQSLYNYDNADFLNFLSGQQFVTREHAFSNYPYPMVLIC